VPACVRCV